MKGRIFSVVSIPHSSSPVVGFRLVFLLAFLFIAIAGPTWIGILSYRHFSSRVDPGAVSHLEAETAILEQKVVEFEEEMALLKETMALVGGLEDKVRAFTGFDRDDHLPAPEIEDLSEREESSARLDRLVTEARARRADFSSILSELTGDEVLSSRVPSIPPVGGWVVREYGYGEDPFTGRVRFHPGMDIAAPKGTPILAPADGKVTFAGLRRDLGLLLVLDHGYGYTTWYAHCGFLKLRQGSLVKRGDVIATVGRTGRATGPHLHYQVRVDGESVDPEAFFVVGLPSFSEFFSSPRKGSGG